MIEEFYFWSSTDRRCVIHREPKGRLAWKLEHIKDPEALRKSFDRGIGDKNRYIVTCNFGEQPDKEKVLSRQITGIMEAIQWAEFMKTEHPAKRMKIWKIC